MTPIVEVIEIARPQATVFDYATDPTRFSEWQAGVVSGEMAGDAPVQVGTKCVTRRKIGLMERPATAEVTKLEPPSAWSVRGVDGPIRAQVDVTVEPLDDIRSKLTIAIEFTGHGIGKALVPLVVNREARKEMPENLARLRDNLEQS